MFIILNYFTVTSKSSLSLVSLDEENVLSLQFSPFPGLVSAFWIQKTNEVDLNEKVPWCDGAMDRRTHVVI